VYGLGICSNKKHLPRKNIIFFRFLEFYLYNLLIWIEPFAVTISRSNENRWFRFFFIFIALSVFQTINRQSRKWQVKMFTKSTMVSVDFSK